jgi:hypothetical protein
MRLPCIDGDHLLKRYLLLIIIIILFATVSSLSATDLDGWILGNYPMALPLSKGKIEASLDYQIINDSVDVLGVRKDEYEKLSSVDRATAPGDLWGVRLMFNYGLFKNTTLMSSFQYRSQDYGFDAVGIKTFDLSLKQSLFNENDLHFPNLAFDVGLRFNSAESIIYNDQSELNAIVQRLSPGTNIRIRIDENFVWFDQEINGDQFSFGARRQGRPDPQVIIRDLWDFSSYVRLTIGRNWNRFFPNLFVEYGYTEISSEVDTTFTEYIPDEFKDDLPRFPIDLSRSENYVKAGMSLQIKLPFRTLFQLEYDYLKLYRGDNLDYMDNNSIIKMDISYFSTPKLVFNIGGIYFERQLNGEIPLLYNRYTQTTFDHPYGYVHIGLTYFFDIL